MLDLCNEVAAASNPKKSFLIGFNTVKQYNLTQLTPSSTKVTILKTINGTLTKKNEITFLTTPTTDPNLGIELIQTRTATCASTSLNSSDYLSVTFKQ